MYSDTIKGAIDNAGTGIAISKHIEIAEQMANSLIRDFIPIDQDEALKIIIDRLAEARSGLLESLTRQQSDLDYEVEQVRVSLSNLRKLQP